MEMIDPVFIYEYQMEKEKITLPALVALVKSIKHKKLNICITRIIQEQGKQWCKVVLGHPEYIYTPDGRVIGTYETSELVNNDGLKIKYHSSISCASEDHKLLVEILANDMDRRRLPIISH